MTQEPHVPFVLNGGAWCDPWQEWALAQGLTPPPWYKPVELPRQIHNHICSPCAVKWHGPKNMPGPCWVCGVSGVEAA